MSIRTITAALAAGLCLSAGPACADVASLQSGWDRAMYRTDDDHRRKAMERLAEQARAEVAAHPDDAALLIWEGIILSSYAGEKGGFGALGLVKEARASLQQALDHDPTALDGSAYTTLGSLYYKVPGWPLGFGSDKKARKNLQAALKIDPDGIDTNYFMGEFLYEQGNYDDARRYLSNALDAPARPGRELADQGRRGEIRTLLTRIEEESR